MITGKMFCVGLAGAFILGIAGGAHATITSGTGDVNKSDVKAEPIHTVVSTPEPVVETKTVEVEKKMTVYRFTDDCKHALDLATSIGYDVSGVAATMGKQYEIASAARLAINGSEFLDLGQVMRDQHDLEQTQIGAYDELAHASYELDTYIDKCNRSVDQ